MDAGRIAARIEVEMRAGHCRAVQYEGVEISRVCARGI